MINYRPHLYLTMPKLDDGSDGNTFYLHLAVMLKQGETIRLGETRDDGPIRKYSLLVEGVPMDEATNTLWAQQMVPFPDPNCDPNDDDCERKIEVYVYRNEGGTMKLKGTGKTLHSNADNKPFI